MTRLRLVYSLSLLSAVFMSAAPGLADPWTTASSYPEAVSLAQAEGKLILADFGRVGCTDCEGMTALFHTPSISQWIQAGFVYWDPGFDSGDARPFISGLNEPSLPVICYVDPAATRGASFFRTTGLMSSSILLSDIRNVICKNYLPLVVTNLPTHALTSADLDNNGNLTIGGWAQTNCLAKAGIKGVPIANVFWRVSESGSGFQAVNRKNLTTNPVSWSTDFAPQFGTNTFECYVQYDDGTQSPNNVVRFVSTANGPSTTPPVVTSPPANQNITAGQNAVFTVQATGTPPPSYQWQFKGTSLVDGTYASGLTDAQGHAVNYVISGAATSQLTIRNAQTLANQGSYAVVIANVANSVTATANLTVDCHPLVQQASSANPTVPAGGTATFQATAYGTPPLQFQWKYSNAVVTNVVTDDSRVSGADTTTLVIANVTTADAGTYSLGVSNGCVSGGGFDYAPAWTWNLNVSTIDTLAPSLAITSHSNLQVVATSAIILAGTASDAGPGGNGITSVTVNGLQAANDTASGSAEADWSRPVNLVAGTNLITVVARDGVNNSTTNVIRIISDTVPPTVAFTAPTAGQRWSNAVFTVQGKATDNQGVAGVLCQTNGVWGSVPTANGWTNWNVAVSLVPGPNTVRAYSQDAVGNVSPTHTVSFVYVLSG